MNEWTDAESRVEFAQELEVPYLGALPFDESLEEAFGDPSRLAQTPFAAGLRELSGSLSSGAE